MSTSLDPDNDPSGNWNGGMQEVLLHVDLFLPNEDEARRIAGETELEIALTKLRSRAQNVVIKRGANGLLMKYGEQTVAVPGFSVRPVDTTGAGDSFNAGFVFQYLQGAPMVQCAMWGHACGALSTRAMGGTAGFPTRNEVEQFLGERAGEVAQIRKAYAGVQETL